MNFQAVFFDLGGVLLRTEYQSPRQQLAERLGVEYEDLERIVFGSESARRASLGQISEEEHWQNVARRFRLKESDIERLRNEFFGGDVLDRNLIHFIRSLRSRLATGLISNAWSGLREYMEKHRFADAFNHIIISAEVGMIKPEAGIYQLALNQAKVRPEAAVFVDDFLENVEAAQKVGMWAIHFRDPVTTLEQLRLLIG
ncbi:MAG: HAD family hydrolase [Anaerolineae bacterium]